MMSQGPVDQQRTSTGSTSKPNILLIMTDQHRYDCLGAYGNDYVQTPHIDRLAADGVVFEQSFCSFPVCTPSRYSLLTGLYARQHLGQGNHSTIPSAFDTFPRMLKNAGYRTRAVGKMHLTPTYLDVGFEEMELAEQDGAGRYDDDYHRYLKDHGVVDRVDLMDQVKEYRDQAPRDYWDTFGAIESDVPEEHHSTTWIGERALAAIDRWDGGGNLLLASFVKPHHPFDPPAPWSRLYRPDDLALLPGWTNQCLPHDLDMHEGYFPHETLTEVVLRQVMAHYYGAISHIDSWVGKMLDRLKSRNVYDDTLVIFTSDHGEYIGFHHLLLKGGYLYDPLVQVPLIIKYPFNQHADRRGTRSDALVSNIDIAPTVLRQAGCEPGPFMTGLDLAGEPAGREVVFAEGPRQQQYMLRSRDHKLLLRKHRDRSLFFDLQEDAMELNNVFHHADYQRDVHRYSEALAEMLLFDIPQPVYLDENAPVIDAGNVPAMNDDHRDVMSTWVRQEMKR
jgi:arylsulfatase A-like enzyme